MDITDVDAASPHNLVFDSNPDHFMCEGMPVTDSSGNLMFDPTEFRDEAGDVISRLRCNLAANWHDNNVGRVRVSAPAGSFVTSPCTRGQIGSLRDCGFTEEPPLLACRAGARVRLRCRVPDDAAVVREYARGARSSASEWRAPCATPSRTTSWARAPRP